LVISILWQLVGDLGVLVSLVMSSKLIVETSAFLQPWKNCNDFKEALFIYPLPLLGFCFSSKSSKRRVWHWLLLHTGFVGCYYPWLEFMSCIMVSLLHNVDWLHGSAESFLTLSNILQQF